MPPKRKNTADMKHFSIFHIPFMAFFSRDLYREAGLRWRGTGFAYLLFLLVICWIPSMVLLDIGLSGFVRDEAPQIIAQVPTIAISKGQASVDAPQPHRITDPKSGKVLVILDTTGAMTSLDKTNALALVTKTAVIIRKNQTETRAFNLNEVREFTVDRDKVTGWMNTMKTYLMPVFFVMAVAASFVYRIVLVLIYAAVGLLFAKGTRFERPYASLVRLAVVAIMPCIVVSTILDLAEIHVPADGLIYTIMTLAYLFLGLKAVAEEQQQSAEVD